MQLLYQNSLELIHMADEHRWTRLIRVVMVFVDLMIIVSCHHFSARFHIDVVDSNECKSTIAIALLQSVPERSFSCSSIPCPVACIRFLDVDRNFVSWRCGTCNWIEREELRGYQWVCLRMSRKWMKLASKAVNSLAGWPVP